MKATARLITDKLEIKKFVFGVDYNQRTKTPGWAFGDSDFWPTEPDRNSVKFFCKKCKHLTSGIHEKEKDECHCPTCKSLLVYCTTCNTCISTTERFHVTLCDNCGKEYVTKDTLHYLKNRNLQAREIVLSGIRPTGEMHLGHLLGVLKQFVELEANDHLCMFFIASWHSLTDRAKPGETTLIGQETVDIAMSYLACGLDPNKSIIYAQSTIPEISELALYLSMFQKKNVLERLPTLKDLVRKQNLGENDESELTDEEKSRITLGHLSYPVLMAADILGPKATIVPVGADQIPNVELAIDLAERFNRIFGPVFTIPRYTKRHIKIPGLTGKKMSKSDTSGVILLSDSLEEIKKKYLTCGVTDIGKVRKGDAGNPNNCLSVYPVFKALLEGDENAIKTIERGCTSGSMGCTECKIELAKEIEKVVAPIRTKLEAWRKRRKDVIEILHYGAVIAKEIIIPTLEEVREKLKIVGV